jgi:hypothetical protein
MNLNEAVNNLSNILFVGRITMPAGPLTAQEHQQLAGDFNLLTARAQLADKLEEELKDTREQLGDALAEIDSNKYKETPEAPEAPPQDVDEVPEVPDENEVEEDERTE